MAIRLVDGRLDVADGVTVAAPERHEAARFLLSLLFVSDDFPESELVRWARHLDVDLAAPTRVALMRRAPSPNPRQPLEETQRICHLVAATVDRPVLADVAGGVVCLFADPAPRPSQHWVGAWERIVPGLGEVGIAGVSVGGPFTGVGGVRRSYGQARSLAERQRTRARVLAAPGVSVYEEGGLAEIVLGHPDTDNLRAYVRRILGPLLDDPRFGGELADTLQAYLATGGSPAGAAERLHLHPSSVKYRVRVIRDLLGGAQLDDHDHRFELELALRMLRAFDDLDVASQPGRTKAEPLSSRRADVTAGHRP